MVTFTDVLWVLVRAVSKETLNSKGIRGTALVGGGGKISGLRGNDSQSDIERLEKDNGIFLDDIFKHHGRMITK